MYPFSGTIPTRKHRVQIKPRPVISLTRLVAAACKANHIELDIVRAEGRKRILPVAWVVEHVALLAGGYTQTQIARSLRRDPSAIHHARRRAEWNVQKDVNYRERVEEIKRAL